MHSLQLRTLSPSVASDKKSSKSFAWKRLLTAYIEKRIAFINKCLIPIASTGSWSTVENISVSEGSPFRATSCIMKENVTWWVSSYFLVSSNAMACSFSRGVIYSAKHCVKCRPAKFLRNVKCGNWNCVPSSAEGSRCVKGLLQWIVRRIFHDNFTIDQDFLRPTTFKSNATQCAKRFISVSACCKVSAPLSIHEKYLQEMSLVLSIDSKYSASSSCRGHARLMLRLLRRFLLLSFSKEDKECWKWLEHGPWSTYSVCFRDIQSEACCPTSTVRDRRISLTVRHPFQRIPFPRHLSTNIAQILGPICEKKFAATIEGLIERSRPISSVSSKPSRMRSVVVFVKLLEMSFQRF